MAGPEQEIELFREELEAAGLAPGEPKYEAVLRARRVKLCQEVKRVGSCEECPACLGCSLTMQHVLDKLDFNQ